MRTETRRRLRTNNALAVSALVMISSAAAFARPASTPTKIAGSPESRANCPVPTLAQCQDPNYLEHDRCGQLERMNRWTCASLLESAMNEKKAQQGEVLSTLPHSFDAQGVGKVVKAAPDPSKPYYVPDLYSYTSQQAARDYQAASDIIGVNKYEAFAANKNVVESCEEYAFEKFYDISEFTRRVGNLRNDHVGQLALAFGPGSDPASIGTRHLNSALLRGKDGRVFGTMLEGQRPKSVFHAIPQNPALKGKTPVPGAPNLLLALQKAGAAQYLAKVYAQPGAVDDKWAAHLQYAKDLLYIPPANPPKSLPLASQPEDPGGFKSIMGTIKNQAGPAAKRKRLGKELDELYDLQLRFRSGFDAWAGLNERYAGSGWSIDELGDPDDGPSTLGSFKAASLSPKPVDKLAPKPAPSKLPSAVKDIAIENPETVQRKKVLAEMIALMDQANDEGCFETGTTACDWSPKLFSSAVRNTFADEQDAAFEQCQSFTKGSIANIKNLNVPFVVDPKHPLLQCVVTTDGQITAKELDDLVAKVDECRQKKAAYLEAKKEEEAKARVAKIPELVDPSTGEVKKPGFTKSRDELMGNDKFGMGYSYDFGFIFDAKHEICQLQLETRGAFNTYANVFGKRFDIIDALASFSTLDREVKVHAKVAGKNLFTPIDEDWKDYDPSFDWSIAKTIGSGKKEIPIVKTWFVIVVVPVKLEAGIAGEAGLNLGLDVEAQGFDNEQCPSARVAGLAEPYASIDGYLEAGIDVFVASVGIRGSLTIVRASLPFTAGIGVEMLQKQGAPWDPSRFQLFADTRMGLKLRTLSGGISVYGEVGWCPFCVRGEKELVAFEGPSYETKLFDQKYKVSLADLGAALGL